MEEFHGEKGIKMKVNMSERRGKMKGKNGVFNSLFL